MTRSRPFLFVLLLMASGRLLAGSGDPDEGDITSPPAGPLVGAATSSNTTKPDNVAWKSLILQSFVFLGVEHGFRYATENGTRDPGRGFFKGYVDSLSNLHGWADGDPFYVNYVGHPMQGAVAGFIWAQNDGRFRNVEFGRDRDYWKSRLRASAYSWVYSTQMEIGLLSEASIGNIQAALPQQGFVDQVITPSVGLGWQVTEDALDRYLVRYLERKTSNRYYRALFRGGLNPARSLANMIGGKYPWARPRDEGEALRVVSPKTPSSSSSGSPGIRPGLPPFELGMNAYFLVGASNNPCLGGGSAAAFRIHPQWQIVGDVNGCKMTGQANNWSGDSLTYVLGPRWTPTVTGRWRPYFQVLAGGSKVSQEFLMPELKAALELEAQWNGSEIPAQSAYTRQFDTGGMALSASGGLDYQMNNAFSFRFFSVEYTKAWVHDLNGFAAPNGVGFKTGFVLRMGTW